MYKPRKKVLLACTEDTSVLSTASDFLLISQIKKNKVITMIKQFQSVKFVGIAVILDLFSSDLCLTGHSGELY